MCAIECTHLTHLAILLSALLYWGLLALPWDLLYKQTPMDTLTEVCKIKREEWWAKVKESALLRKHFGVMTSMHLCRNGETSSQLYN